MNGGGIFLIQFIYQITCYCKSKKIVEGKGVGLKEKYVCTFYELRKLNVYIC